MKKRWVLATDTAKCCKISAMFASEGPGHSKTLTAHTHDKPSTAS